MHPTLLNSQSSALLFSRRKFLQSGVAASAVLAGALGSVATCFGAKPSNRVIVGAHPWVYAATQPSYDIYPVLDGIFADMQYAGLDGIELMHTALRPAKAVERIGELSEKHKLPVIGTSFGGDFWNRAQHNAVFDDAELVVTRLAKLGGRTFGISVGSAGKKKTEEQLDAQAELLRKVVALCEKHNVVPNLHNHTYEVENNEHDLSGTITRIKGFKLGPDLGWLARAKVDPVDFLQRHAETVVFLHLRDQTREGKWSEALGEGAMDYAAIGAQLRKMKFAGDAVIELAHERSFKPTRPLRESLKMSREYLRKTCGF